MDSLEVLNIILRIFVLLIGSVKRAFLSSIFHVEIWLRRACLLLTLNDNRGSVMRYFIQDSWPITQVSTLKDAASIKIAVLSKVNWVPKKLH